MSSLFNVIISFLCIKHSNTAPCTNYGNYTTTNGEDIALNITNKMKYTNLGPNSIEFNSNSTSQFMNLNRTCNNIDGCEYTCNHLASCAQGTINCNSPIGCNIKCIETFSCGELLIYATNNSLSNLTITCHQHSCTNLKLIVTNINSVYLHCIGPLACENVITRFNKLIYSSVSCYDLISCNNLQIYSFQQYTQLIMYKYSFNIRFYNNFGYNSYYPNILCELDNKYIKYNFTNNNNQKTIQV
eukprot:405396_1